MRQSWSGTISFGLVSVPVGLVPAQTPQDVSFKTLVAETGRPVKYRKWSPELDREVEAHELVKGYEVSKGQYVVIDEAELAAVARKREKTMEITKVVPLEQVDPVFFEKAYLVAPNDEGVGLKAYKLLVRALEETGRAAIARAVLWGKERVVLIRPVDGALVAEFLYWQEDVRAPAQFAASVASAPVSDAEVQVATQLIDSLAGDFDPAEYESGYRKDVRALIDAKVAGQQFVVADEPDQPAAPVIDLLDALKASIVERDAEKKAAAKPRRSRARKAA